MSSLIHRFQWLLSDPVEEQDLCGSHFPLWPRSKGLGIVGLGLWVIRWEMIARTASVENFISTIQQMSVSWLTQPLWVKALSPLPHEISQWPASLQFNCCAHFLRNVYIICETINEKYTIRAARQLWAFGRHRKFMFLLVVMLHFTFTHTGFLAHLHCVTSECLTGSFQVHMPSVIYRHLCWLKKRLPYGRAGWQV